MSCIIELLVAATVLATTPNAVHPPGDYEIRRVAACREVAAGAPVEPTETFLTTDRRIVLWFQGEDAARDVAVRTEWYVNGVHEVAASHTVTVVAGSNTGYFTLEMPAGTPLPAGPYRVDLTVNERVVASHRFRVVSGDVPRAAPPPAPERTEPEPPRVMRAESGFSVPLLPGWKLMAVKGVALAASLGGDRDVGVVVVMQSERASVSVAGVLERARAAMAVRENPRLVAHQVTAMLDRTCSIATIEDRDGSRQKAYVIPRDTGAASRHYYVLVGSSPGPRFAELEPALERMARGFRVEPMAKVPIRSLEFPVMFTAGVSRDGQLAQPSSTFPPDEPTVHVRFKYRGGEPGQELVSVWHRITDGKAREFARSSMRLEKAEDIGQFSYSEGALWPVGSYRVDIRDGGRTVYTVLFKVAPRR